MKILSLLAVILLCGCSTPKQDIPVHWFTFPMEWVGTNVQYWADIDLDFVGDGLRIGRSYAAPSKIQFGFREDGVVVWRKSTGKFL